MPGDYLIDVIDIKRFYSYQPFFIKDEKGVKHKIDNSFDIIMAFNYYYEIWDNFRQFKILPHGRGTMHELPWVLDVIKTFNRVWEEIEVYRVKRAK